MGKRSFKRIMVILLSLVFTVTALFQSYIPAQGAVEIKTKVIEFAESPYNDQTMSVIIPNLFSVSNVSIDTGVVEYSVNGESVTVNVYGGVPAKKPYSMTVTVSEEKGVNIFKSNIDYNNDGFSGILNKVGEPVFNSGTYTQQYRGTVTNPEYDFYKYTVTIKYTENKAPEVKVNKPADGKSFNKGIKLDALVKDENVEDSVSVFYSIYGQGIKVQDTPLGSAITADGSEQPLLDTINIEQYNLKEGMNELSIWAVDKKGAKSTPVIIPFILDLTPPAAPVISQDPGNDTPTNKDVQITITYPDDAVTKQYKEGPDGILKDYTEPFDISVNEAVYSVCTDEAGNISPVAVIDVNNIDKNPPSAPKIISNPNQTVSTPINVSIYPGKDNESGIDRTEYSLKGATVSDWKKYDQPFLITKEGETEILARSIDKAGNVSDVTSKTVKIDKPAVVSSPPVGTNSVPNVSVSTLPLPTATTKVVTEPTPQIPVGVPVDLAVFISAEKTTFGENEAVTFTINYRNKLKNSAEGVIVKAEIPQYTTILDSAGGTVKGSSIEWNIGNLAGEASGEVKYSVQVGLLDKAEINSSNKAVIKSSVDMNNKDDDESVYLFMLYSNRFNNKIHQKFILGYIDNTFRPENSITRAEVAAILIRVLGLGEGTPDGKVYPDINSKHWAYGYIYSATKYGLFEGYKDGSFKPDSFITRAELSTALARYLKFKDIEPQKIHFTDITGHWAKNYIEEIYRIKLIAGYEDGKFMPDSPIKRSETVTIVDRMLFRGPLKGADTSFTDVKKDHWAYGHIVESSMDHYYTRNIDGSETKVNKE